MTQHIKLSYDILQNAECLRNTFTLRGKGEDALGTHKITFLFKQRFKNNLRQDTLKSTTRFHLSKSSTFSTHSAISHIRHVYDRI
ncbi:CLUMA_CG019350, isoform A [Clunio marinus]|uniref:CLUMA_CG019350, isoform A n=1 Tax=Clunio marinus TaxID=568069 RepID=A0A1J1J3S7_9DIPT|nr:CLUMA_CG019350, isoform A [Clunio marinus]